MYLAIFPAYKVDLLINETGITTFNRYLKYFNALYRWVIANNALITENPFEGGSVIEKKKSIAAGRKAYTPKQEGTRHER